jgi:hypothetical protein
MGEHADHLHQGFAPRALRIQILGQRLERSFGPSDLLHDEEQILQTSAESVEFPDDQFIALAQLLQSLCQLWLLVRCARDRVCEDLLLRASLLQQLSFLSLSVLLIGADPSITNFHDVVVLR